MFRPLLLFSALLAVFAVGSAQKFEWTAYVGLPNSTPQSCVDPSITGDFYLVSLATDTLGRVWQFSGTNLNYICPNGTAFLRYFDRNIKNWTVVWTSADSKGPAKRGDHALWVDKDFNIYIFGGFSKFCDFWKFSMDTKTWKDLTVGDCSLNFVTKGVEDASNYPGHREGSGYWYTSDDNCLWIFSGFDEIHSWPYRPDLWRYNVTSQKWAFVAGLMERIGGPNPVFNDAFEVTPFQRWAPFSAVDDDNNLWLYGGYVYDDLWMFNRSSGWQYISGNKDYYNYNEGCNATITTLPPGVFSSRHRPDCSLYSSMTYAGENTLALWTSYSNNDAARLWLYNITSQEWAWFMNTTGLAVANVLFKADASTTPGITEYTRTISSKSLWIVADESQGVFVIDFQSWCSEGNNPCDEHATCNDNVGLLESPCTCNVGYEGDGYTCAKSTTVPVASNTPITSNAPSASNGPTIVTGSPQGLITSSTSQLRFVFKCLIIIASLIVF